MWSHRCVLSAQMIKKCLPGVKSKFNISTFPLLFFTCTYVKSAAQATAVKKLDLQLLSQFTFHDRQKAPVRSCNIISPKICVGNHLWPNPRVRYGVPRSQMVQADSRLRPNLLFFVCILGVINTIINSYYLVELMSTLMFVESGHERSNYFLTDPLHKETSVSQMLNWDISLSACKDIWDYLLRLVRL